MGFTFNDWGTQPDPNLLFYRHFHKQPKGADFRNWNDDRGSDLLDQGRREQDPAKRKEIYVEFQKHLAEQVPTIMMFSSDYVVVASNRVKNFVHHPTGWYFGLVDTWVEA
jgi:ABC-type transport system substrate-binding protein